MTSVEEMQYEETLVSPGRRHVSAEESRWIDSCTHLRILQPTRQDQSLCTLVCGFSMLVHCNLYSVGYVCFIHEIRVSYINGEHTVH